MTEVRRCQPWLGTFVDVALEGDASASALQALAATAFAAIQRVHEAMSFHLPGSELSGINRHAAARSVTISEPMQHVLTTALDLSRRSAGAFDITVACTLSRQGVLPSLAQPVDRRATWRDIELQGDRVRFHRQLLIDLGGIAKGFAVDQACAVLPVDIRHCVNAGGDLRMSHWADELAHILLPGRRRLTRPVPMRNAALATSADQGHSRYGVTVGMHRRRLRRRSSSWSVFADTAMQADALTKVLRIHPEPGPILESLGADGYRLDAAGAWHRITAQDLPCD